MIRGYLDRMARPLDGHVMPPASPQRDQSARIICGHPVVQALGEEARAEFETFVRDVLRTELK